MESNEYVKISGPVYIGITNYQHKKYYFLGDIHNSMDNSCTPQTERIEQSRDDCLDFDIETRKPIGKMSDNGEQCYDVTRFIDKIITDNPNEYIDVYTEEEYEKPKDIEEPSVSDVNEIGFLAKVHRIFWSCYIKNSCPYNNARFHYVDIRQVENNIGHYIFETMYYQIEDLLINYLTKKVDFSYNWINQFFNASFWFQDKPKGIPFSRDEIYFRICLESDNYIEECNDLFFDVPVALNVKKVYNDFLFDKNIIVKRDGKIMHRIRAQLYGLEKDESFMIAASIVDHIWKEYKNYKKNEFIRITKSWKELKDIYDNIYTYNTNEIPKIIHRLRTNWVLFVISQYMDAYLLARMFRKYTKNGRQNDEHMDSSKVVVFAGYNHIKS